MSASTESAGAAPRADVEAALLLLSKLGVSVDDLAAATSASPATVPTFAQYVPQVAAATCPGTRKAYGTYWNRLVERWGSRGLDEPTPLELERLGQELRAAR